MSQTEIESKINNLLKYEYDYILIMKNKISGYEEIDITYSDTAILNFPKHYIDIINYTKNKQFDNTQVEQNKTNEIYNHRILQLNNVEHLNSYVISCFELLRQIPCKMIAKEWIKVIEPKKKSTNPYSKGVISKPNWWPQSIPHKEPDHLNKKDRIILLTAMVMHVLPKYLELSDIDDVESKTLLISCINRVEEKEILITSIFSIIKGLHLNEFISRVVDIKDFAMRNAQRKRKEKSSDLLRCLSNNNGSHEFVGHEIASMEQHDSSSTLENNSISTYISEHTALYSPSSAQYFHHNVSLKEFHEFIDNDMNESQ